MAKGLGKGIGALFPEVEVSAQEKVEEINILEIRPNPYQPRKIFNDESIEELKQSIIENGILQPLIVRKSEIKGYEIVAGERRYRAAKEAKLKTVPAVVRKLSDDKMMQLAVLENLQREDLTPIEEANAYQMLMNRLRITQEELSKRLGKSRPHVANHIRLLSLPTEIQQLINSGTLSMGHGRALLGLKKKEKLQALTDKVIKEQLSVRQLELLVQQLNENVPRETPKQPSKDVFIVEQESFLRERFGTTVKIKQNRDKDKGKIEIEFLSKDDLERILDMLKTDELS